jgi:hypothetical protein
MSNEHGLDDGKVATGWSHGRELPGYHGNEGMVGGDIRRCCSICLVVRRPKAYI